MAARCRKAVWWRSIFWLKTLLWTAPVYITVSSWERAGSRRPRWATSGLSVQWRGSRIVQNLRFSRSCRSYRPGRRIGVEPLRPVPDPYPCKRFERRSLHHCRRCSQMPYCRKSCCQGCVLQSQTPKAVLSLSVTRLAHALVPAHALLFPVIKGDKAPKPIAILFGLVVV